MADSKMNEDLLRERQSCSFDKEELTNFIRDGPENREKLRKIAKFSEEIIEGEENNLHSLNTVERLSRDWKVQLKMLKHPDALSVMSGTVAGTNPADIMYPEANSTAVHLVMFLPVLRMQSTPEQADEWLMKAMTYQITGTYAQTELGHGTNLKKLETTATYDPTTQEFVLNTPALSSYKWWPGGLGSAANHAIVTARLITKGQDYGAHNFMVQLRDLETHKPLPGISVGTIGTKLGYNDANNGFLGMKNIRIPRKNMLMKFAQASNTCIINVTSKYRPIRLQVLPDGTYKKPPQEKLSYGGMVLLRASFTMMSAYRLQKAVTIATRYSAVRHQSELIPGRPEPQILDYQTQQLKILPTIALAFGFHFAGKNLWDIYKANAARMEKGDFELLPELHALSCCLKAMVTQESAEAIDIVRRGCGGHGFMASSALPNMWASATGACTYEGENTVMLLQTARFLLKSKEPFLSHSTSLERKVDDVSDAKWVEAIFAAVVDGNLARIRKGLQESKDKGFDEADAKNRGLVEMESMSVDFARLFTIKSFKSTIETAKISSGTKNVLEKLFELLACHWILATSGQFMIYAGLDQHSLEAVKNRRLKLLEVLRPEAVNIVDSFDFQDSELCFSTLGCYDGNVYERLFEAAKKTSLNKADVQPAFEAHLKPLIKANL